MKILVMNDATIGVKTRRQIHSWWSKNKDMVLEAVKKLDSHMQAVYSLEITQTDGVYQQWLDLKATVNGLFIVMFEQPETDQESGSSTQETIAELQV